MFHSGTSDLTQHFFIPIAKRMHSSYSSCLFFSASTCRSHNCQPYVCLGCNHFNSLACPRMICWLRCPLLFCLVFQHFCELADLCGNLPVILSRRNSHPCHAIPWDTKFILILMKTHLTVSGFNGYFLLKAPNITQCVILFFRGIIFDKSQERLKGFILSCYPDQIHTRQDKGKMCLGN